MQCAQLPSSNICHYTYPKVNLSVKSCVIINISAPKNITCPKLKMADGFGQLVRGDIEKEPVIRVHPPPPSPLPPTSSWPELAFILLQSNLT